MFLKSKIGLTILSLYEIVAIMLLHCPNTCNAMFGMTFCTDSVFKYFIVCIAVPLIVFLIVMWIMEIIDHIRRRHSFLYKAKHAVKNMADHIRERVSESVSSKDIEKMISAALVLGLRKYANRNARARQMLDEMSGDIDAEYGIYASYDDDDDDTVIANTQKSKSRNNKKKK